jgi:anaerobic magnesium-protoporphyrin IX monomethyl ester cyclase
MISLYFPPVASPTYVPLGVSLLKSYLDRQCGSGSIHIQDLNIPYWDYLCSERPEFGGYQRFLKGQGEPFTRDFYESHLPAASLLREESSEMLQAVRDYLDLKVLSASLEKLFLFLSSIMEQKGSLLMFSCLFPNQLLFTLGFTRWISETQDCTIYLGGASSILIDPDLLLISASWIEGIFTGEGEIALETFIQSQETSLIPGLYRRHGDHVIQEAPPAHVTMDKLPIPDFSWAPLDSYYNPYPVLPVQLSRGCKWRRCRFCAHNFSFGSYRCTHITQAVDILEHYVRNNGVTHFYITDQYLDGIFLEPFAHEILDRNLKITYTFMGRPDEDITGEIFKLLYRSGCTWISWGVESGSSRLLDIAAKGTNPVTVSKILRDSKMAGINNLALMIFGLPQSDDQALEETFDFLLDNRDWIDSMTASEFQLYRGTPFGNHPEKYGMRITGAEIFCRIDGLELASLKLKHTDLSRGEEPESLRGPQEARRWKRRKIWIYPDSFWDHLPSEHYLILIGQSFDAENPDDPENPEFWDDAI